MENDAPVAPSRSVFIVGRLQGRCLEVLYVRKPTLHSPEAQDEPQQPGR